MSLRCSTVYSFVISLSRAIVVMIVGVLCFASCNTGRVANLDNNHESASPEEHESISADELFRSEFSTERFEATISNDRCAIIYRGYYPFSINSPNAFAKLLLPLFKETDYYRYDAEWGNPSVAPFYHDFGLSKDGTIVVVLPNGGKRCFSLSGFSRSDVLGYIEEGSREPSK
jgi:hypothetical protein